MVCNQTNLLRFRRLVPLLVPLGGWKRARSNEKVRGAVTAGQRKVRAQIVRAQRQASSATQSRNNRLGTLIPRRAVVERLFRDAVRLFCDKWARDGVDLDALQV